MYAVIKLLQFSCALWHHRVYYATANDIATFVSLSCHDFDIAIIKTPNEPENLICKKRIFTI